jgi:hypothetical protein
MPGVAVLLKMGTVIKRGLTRTRNRERTLVPPSIGSSEMVLIT